MWRMPGQITGCYEGNEDAGRKGRLIPIGGGGILGMRIHAESATCPLHWKQIEIRIHSDLLAFSGLSGKILWLLRTSFSFGQSSQVDDGSGDCQCGCHGRVCYASTVSTGGGMLTRHGRGFIQGDHSQDIADGPPRPTKND